MSPALSAVTRRNFVLLVILTSLSCDRESETSNLPLETAYSDGFEAVVYDVRDGAPTNIRSVLLCDAETAIAQGSHALLAEKTDLIRQRLSAGSIGDSEVHLTVRHLHDGTQRNRLSFHEQMRTYVYEYDVKDGRLVPVSSEYHDLRASKTVRYVRD